MTSSEANATLLQSLPASNSPQTIQDIIPLVTTALSPSGSTDGTSPTTGGSTSTSGQELTESLSSVTDQLKELQNTQQSSIDTLGENTKAIVENTQAKSSTTSSTGSSVGGIASSLLGGGLSALPLISGLLSLFGGGGSSQTTTALPTLSLPAGVTYNAEMTGQGSGQTTASDYNQQGAARPESTFTASGALSVQTDGFTVGISVPAGTRVQTFGWQIEAQPAAGIYKRANEWGGVYPACSFATDTLTLSATAMNQYSTQVQLRSAIT